MENQPDVLRGRLIMKACVIALEQWGRRAGKATGQKKTALGGLLEDDFVKSFTFLKKRQRGTEKENK